MKTAHLQLEQHRELLVELQESAQMVHHSIVQLDWCQGYRDLQEKNKIKQYHHIMYLPGEVTVVSARGDCSTFMSSTGLVS